MKENKEPSPKVKRRRSVKISNVALEPAQWQNDALQILTSTNDYRSMNDFLMKKVGANVHVDFSLFCFIRFPTGAFVLFILLTKMIVLS